MRVEIKVGTRVKVEYEGVVTNREERAPVAMVYDDTGATCRVPLSALTVVAPPLPPEPEIGAVVIDRHGRCWQRLADAMDFWYLAGAAPYGRSWDALNSSVGPLTRLVPEEGAR